MNDHLKYEGRIDRETAANHLETLAAGLRAGTLLLESGDTSMNVDVDDEMTLNVEAKAKPEGKNKLEVEMSWRSAPNADPASAHPFTVIAGDELADRMRRNLFFYGDDYRREGVLDHADGEIRAAEFDEPYRLESDASTRVARSARPARTRVKKLADPAETKIEDAANAARRAVRARKRGMTDRGS
jgi:amphi-Trp domain-containing protein